MKLPSRVMGSVNFVASEAAFSPVATVGDNADRRGPHEKANREAGRGRGAGSAEFRLKMVFKLRPPLQSPLPAAAVSIRCQFMQYAFWWVSPVRGNRRRWGVCCEPRNNGESSVRCLRGAVN